MAEEEEVVAGFGGAEEEQGEELLDLDNLEAPSESGKVANEGAEDSDEEVVGGFSIGEDATDTGNVVYSDVTVGSPSPPSTAAPAGAPSAAEAVYGEVDFKGKGDGGKASAIGAEQTEADVVYGELSFEAEKVAEPGEVVYGEISGQQQQHEEIPAEMTAPVSEAPAKQEIYASVTKAKRPSEVSELDFTSGAGPALPKRNPSVRSTRSSVGSELDLTSSGQASAPALPQRALSIASQPISEGDSLDLDVLTSNVAETNIDAARTSPSSFADPLADARAEEQADAIPPSDLTFEQFGALYFTEAVEGSATHQKTRLTQPLMKQVWGDGDSQRVLLTWTALLFFLGDAQLAGGQNLTNLETVQLIVNTGRTRENTRNEIYAQICKQILGNPNRYSHARAWIMMALCGSHFMPKDDFAEVTRRFIATHSPPGYRAFLLQRFTRCETALIPRASPPTALEINAAFTGKPIQIRVNFYFTSIVVLVDAASTMAEINEAIYKHPDIAEEYGFQVYIMGDQFHTRGKKVELVEPLDDPAANVLDIISRYEALVPAGKDWKELDETRNWSIVLRKQAFTPWLESIDNLNLIYRQIWDGMERGEYHTEDQDALAENLAIRYFVTHGEEMSRSTLLQQLEAEPVSGMQGKRAPWWADRVVGKFNERQFFNKPATVTDLKVEVIEKARNTWVREFSLNFANCSVTIDGKTSEGVTVLVNSHGLLISTNRNDDDAANVTFDTMIDISDCSDIDGKRDLQTFKVSFLDETGNRRQDLKIEGAKALKIQQALEECLQGIIFRSKYCIAKKAHNKTNQLAFKEGDLIVLESIFAVPQSDTVFGICERTKLKGQVPIENAFVCPVLRRPSANQMVRYVAAASGGLLNQSSTPKSSEESMMHL